MPSWVVASDELGGRGKEFDVKVKETIEMLLQDRPGFGQPSQHPEHVIALMAGYELIYEWATDFNLQGIAVAHYLVLLLIRHK